MRNLASFRLQNGDWIDLASYPSLKVARHLGQVALSVARRLNILDRELRVTSTKTDVIIPLSRMPSEEDLVAIKSALKHYQILNYPFRKREPRMRSLIEILNGRLPPHLMACLPRAYDVIGDVVILELPKSLLAYGQTVGDAVKQLNPRCRTVLAKAGPVADTFRTRDFLTLSGEQTTITEHSERGCLFRLDPRKVYFSPRLSYERQRLASKVMRGEIIVDMFAGAGPISIVIARSGNAERIYAFDINPEAVLFMLQNIKLNSLRGKMTAILADVTGITANMLFHSADRVIMNLPERSLMLIPESCSFLKPEGGVIHLYTFASEGVSRENLSVLIRERVESAGRRLVAIEAVRTVKAVAPRQWQLAYDIRVA